MKIDGMTLEEARKYLIKKGWTFNKAAAHAWAYALPPFPAQYRIEDAVSLQKYRDEKRLPKD